MSCSLLQRSQQADPGQCLDRAIAEQIGVSDRTVNRARKSPATHVAPEDEEEALPTKRTGRDCGRSSKLKPSLSGLRGCLGGSGHSSCQFGEFILIFDFRSPPRFVSGFIASYIALPVGRGLAQKF